MDVAFSTAKYPSYTTGELLSAIESGKDGSGEMALEVTRRKLAASGDVKSMTKAERLRFFRKG